MVTGWVCWETQAGLTRAHYVGTPGGGPLCGWRGEADGIPAQLRSEGRIPAPADSTRCARCVTATVAR